MRSTMKNIETKALIADIINGVVEVNFDELEHDQDIEPNMFMFYEQLADLGDDEVVAVLFHPNHMSEQDREFYNKIKSEYGVN